MLTSEELESLQDALEKATPGTWHRVHVQDGDKIWNEIHTDQLKRVIQSLEAIEKFNDEDCYFITLAKNLMPALIAAAKEGLEARAIKEFPESYQ